MNERKSRKRRTIETKTQTNHENKHSNQFTLCVCYNDFQITAKVKWCEHSVERIVELYNTNVTFILRMKYGCFEGYYVLLQLLKWFASKNMTTQCSIYAFAHAYALVWISLVLEIASHIFHPIEYYEYDSGSLDFFFQMTTANCRK